MRSPSSRWRQSGVLVISWMCCFTDALRLGDRFTGVFTWGAKMDDVEQTAVKITRRKKWRRRAIGTGAGLCGLVLVASLVANGVLYRQARASYRELNDVRLDPYGLKHVFYDPPRTTQSDVPVLVFFGDSRAEQWRAPMEARFRFLNRGIGGQSSEQVRGRFDLHVKPLKPRVLVVQAGINDLKSVALFPERRDAIVASCKANLRDIVARATGEGSIVIITTIFPTGPVSPARRTQWSPEIDRAVEEVNADVRMLASDKVRVLDAYSILGTNGHVPGELAVDTLHVNDKAYAKLNAELAKVLEGMDAERHSGR